MRTAKWTASELKEFTKLVDLSGSRIQMDRIRSRVEMPAFIKRHGKEKCDAMWAHINAKEPK